MKTIVKEIPFFFVEATFITDQDLSVIEFVYCDRTNVSILDNILLFVIR